MNRRNFLKTTGMTAAVLMLNPLKLISELTKPLSDEIVLPNFNGSVVLGTTSPSHYLIVRDGSFFVGNEENYIRGFSNGEVRIKGEIIWT